jgi:hypothetical protein
MCCGCEGETIMCAVGVKERQSMCAVGVKVCAVGVKERQSCVLWV